MKKLMQQIEAAQNELSELCKGKQFRMSIPVQETDSDVVIGSALATMKMQAEKLKEMSALMSEEWGDGAYRGENPIMDRLFDLLDDLTLTEGKDRCDYEPPLINMRLPVYQPDPEYLKTFVDGRKAYNNNEDWYKAGDYWRGFWLSAGETGDDEKGHWQLFTLSEKSKELLTQVEKESKQRRDDNFFDEEYA